MLIHNVRAVSPSCVVDDAWAIVENGYITDLGAGRPPHHSPSISGEGAWLMPGFIDLHSDALEHEIEPRPSALFDVELALMGLEAKVLAHGVTCLYHALSCVSVGGQVRSLGMVEKIIRCIGEMEGRTSIRHKIHARYDIVETDFAPLVERLMERGTVQMLSLMDHSPGQGQYKEVEAFVRFLQRHRHVSEEDARKLAVERQELARRPIVEKLAHRLTQEAMSHDIPVASHDDDSVEKIARMREEGASISEFPINIESARYALSRGLHVVMGAPNVLRGVSNAGNLRAIDAIGERCVDILCSDYMPTSLLYAVFKLYHGSVPMHQAVNMVSLNPAKAARIDAELGSLEIGKRADLILVRDEGLPKVEYTLVDGVAVYVAGKTARTRSECLATRI